MIVQGPDGKRIKFPDGTPPEQIKAVMAKQYGAPSPMARPAPAPVPQMSRQEAARLVMENVPIALPGQPSVLQAVNSLPSGLGFTGGLFGGPLGAGAGGAIGEGARQLAMGEPIDKGRVLWSGALEGGLRGAGGALKWASKAAPAAGKLGAKVLANPAVREYVPGAPQAAGILKMAERVKIARLLNSAKFQLTLRQSPQTAVSMIQQALSSESDSTRR